MVSPHVRNGSGATERYSNYHPYPREKRHLYSALKQLITYTMQQAAGLTVTISQSLEGVDERAWQQLLPSSVRGYRFFQTLQETLRHEFTFYYISITEGSRLVCLAPCFLANYSFDTTMKGLWKAVCLWVKRIWPRFLTARFLVCGSPTSEAWLGLTASVHPSLSSLLLDAMRTIAQQTGSRWLAFKDFPDAYEPFLDPLLNKGFCKIPSYPVGHLDLWFASFDEYLASLSKATRKDLRRKFRKIDGCVQVEMEARSELHGPLLDQAYTLYLNTFNKSQTQFELVTKEFFERISSHLPNKTTYFLWRIEGRLVAFNLSLVDGSTLHDEYLGLDYGVAHQYHLYYLTFRDMIRWCLQHDIRRYATGTLNYDPKKRLDFRLLPLYVYVSHTHRLMNGLFRLVSPLIDPVRFDPILQSFYQKLVTAEHR